MLCLKPLEMIAYLEMIKNYCDARGTCFECVFNDHGKGCMFWHGGITPCDCKFCPMYQGYYANEKRCIWNRLPFEFDVEVMCNMYERIKNETIWEMKNHENEETVENR